MKPARSAADHDTFIKLILVACEDPTVRQRLLLLLHLPHNARLPLLRNLIEEMRAGGAPQDFIEAIAFLEDEDIAGRVTALLSGD